MDSTVADWQSWSDLHAAYDGPWRDLVWTSGRVLQGLSFQPSGAIVAAATTSLPEGVGGERNWDYRYSWVRDASFTMQALWVAACPDEATDFFEFMTTAAASSIGPDHSLQIMFGVGGEHDLTERELHHLPRWRDSGPVRVGNGAWNQRQINVYGGLLGAAAQLSAHIDTIDEDTRRFLIACARLPTPVGTTASRLPELFAAPIVVAVAAIPLVALIAATASIVLLLPPVSVTEVQERGDPALSAEFYAPLLNQLTARRAAGPIEVVPTQRRGKAAFVAPVIAIAKGWSRQADTGRNAIFYDGTLNADTYRKWLDSKRFTALEQAVHRALDDEAAAEIGREQP